jgi:hypothetical protein
MYQSIHGIISYIPIYIQVLPPETQSDPHAYSGRHRIIKTVEVCNAGRFRVVVWPENALLTTVSTRIFAVPKASSYADQSRAHYPCQ